MSLVELMESDPFDGAIRSAGSLDWARLWLLEGSATAAITRWTGGGMTRWRAEVDGDETLLSEAGGGSLRRRVTAPRWDSSGRHLVDLAVDGRLLSETLVAVVDRGAGLCGVLHEFRDWNHWNVVVWPKGGLNEPLEWATRQNRIRSSDLAIECLLLDGQRVSAAPVSGMGFQRRGNVAGDLQWRLEGEWSVSDVVEVVLHVGSREVRLVTIRDLNDEPFPNPVPVGVDVSTTERVETVMEELAREWWQEQSLKARGLHLAAITALASGYPDDVEESLRIELATTEHLVELGELGAERRSGPP